MHVMQCTSQSTRPWVRRTQPQAAVAPATAVQMLLLGRPTCQGVRSQPFIQVGSCCGNQAFRVGFPHIYIACRARATYLPPDGPLLPRAIHAWSLGACRIPQQHREACRPNHNRVVLGLQCSSLVQERRPVHGPHRRQRARAGRARHCHPGLSCTGAAAAGAQGCGAAAGCRRGPAQHGPALLALVCCCTCRQHAASPTAAAGGAESVAHAVVWLQHV